MYAFEPVTDEQIAHLSAAEASVEDGRRSATAILPLIMYGAPYEDRYMRITQVTENEYGDSLLESTSTVQPGLSRSQMLAEEGISDISQLSSYQLGHFARKEVEAFTCFERGSSTNLLVIRPDTPVGIFGQILREVSDYKYAGPSGKGGRRQGFIRGELCGRAMQQLLDDAGVVLGDPNTYHTGSVRGTGWNKLPDVPQPGLVPGRARIIARKERQRR